MKREELTAKERAFVEEHERKHKLVKEIMEERNQFNAETDYAINAELEKEGLTYTANRLPADELEEVDDVGVKMIEEALREYWGERCEDYEAGCGVCEGWRAFDKAFPKEVQIILDHKEVTNNER